MKNTFFAVVCVFVLARCSSSVTITNTTPQEFTRNTDNTYPLSLEVKDYSVFSKGIRAYAIVNGTAYRMRKSGNAYLCRYHAPCADSLSVRFQIFNPKIFPFETRRFDHPPKDEYRIIIHSGNDIIVSQKHIGFLCRNTRHPKCVSEYVVIQNNGNAPVVITAITVKDGKNTHVSATNASSANPFEILLNGSRPPVTLHCGETLLFVVCFDHACGHATGVITVTSDHPHYPEVRIDVEGTYTGHMQ